MTRLSAAQSLSRESREWLAGVARPAIEILGEPVGTRPGRSFLGGAPTLPAGLAWPENRSGFAMPFVAQIDLSAIPESSGSPLPRDGVLFFFHDIDVEDGRVRKGPPVVLYAPESAAVPDREAPIPASLRYLNRFYDDGYFVGGGAHMTYDGGMGPPERYRQLFPKIPIRAEWFDCLPPWYEDEITGTAPQEVEDWHWRRNDERLRHGGNREDWGARLGLPRATPPPDMRLGVSDTGWPWTWALVELIAGSMGNPKNRYGIPGWKDWVARARAGALDRAIDAGDAQAFGAWILSHKYKHFADPAAAQPFVAKWETIVELSTDRPQMIGETITGLAHLIDARHDRSDLLPGGVRDFASHALGPTFGQRHQMLGWPQLPQGNLAPHEGRLVLLQLWSDNRMLANWGDADGLFFWIEPEDLAARRFDQTWLTLQI